MRLRLTRREALATGLAAVAGVAAPALARAAAPTTQIGGPAYGTWWSLTLPAKGDALALRPVIEQVLARIDRLMSPWRPDSTITLFNAARSTDWQRVGSETATVARATLALREASAGAFDPAVGPLVSRWGFGPISGEKPSSDTGFAVGDDALCKHHPGLTLDLCGIAKGYALDQMGRVLRDRGEEDFVIDLGGEIAAMGWHPDGRSWHVAIEDPREGRSGAVEMLRLSGNAIATSGDRTNGFTVGTRRYSHIIDPVTAEPVEGSTASVSVLADDAMTADGWATALMAAGADGPARARNQGLDALFFIRDGESLRRVPVGRFDDHLA
ncbi:FAD:protein FMN transferase [Microvirga guangxiensis]|uniref:FAD:protein FMN transferase n=1 Tax=Microvirga guangxiensis TaxID=549386 RepID=A0A1G5KA53_9HYPH|nr:FAD:protein FMN transferase [Microvirga guangxiensis]SCY97486.1 thiamine biosynthesis lipoprotein [Microvirga guangxiensis]